MTVKPFSLISVSGILAVMLFTVSGCTSSSNTNTEALQVSSSSKVTRKGEVYLFRGLANVFSRGIDTIGERMVRRGLNAHVYNHSAWRGLAEDIVSRAKLRRVKFPIIIMGHSLGGNATMQMAKFLGDRGVKVAYAVSFDPTITTFVGSNVGEVINYYLPNSDHTNIVKKEANFKGSLRNLDVSTVAGITHVTIEKYDLYQTNVINTTLALAKTKTRSAVSREIADVDQR